MDTLPDESKIASMNSTTTVSSLLEDAWSVFIAVDRKDYVFNVVTYTGLFFSSWLIDITQ
jgi:hypothetical protein